MRRQRAIVNALEFIGDARGVPTLLEAMRSPHEWVAIEAASALRFHFPGAPGVTAAFRDVRHAKMKAQAAQYLSRYDPGMSASLAAARNAYQRASELIQQGDDEGARAHLPPILRDPQQAEAIVRFNAEWVGRVLAAHPESERDVGRALMPLLRSYAQTGDYLQALAAAEVLSVLSDPAAVEPLRELLEKKDGALFDASTRVAAYALIDRGGEVRSAAIARLRAREDWPALEPIVNVAGRRDEAALLVRQLGAANPSFHASLPARWLFYRLGRLRDERAIPALVKALQHPYWDTSTVVEALKRIGGPKREAAVLPLLRTPEPGTRQAAMEILLEVQGRRFLPLLRRMLNEPARCARHGGDVHRPHRRSIRSRPAPASVGLLAGRSRESLLDDAGRDRAP